MSFSTVFSQFVFVEFQVENVVCTDSYRFCTRLNVSWCEIVSINYEDNTAKIQKGNKSRTIHMDKLRRANINEIPIKQLEKMAKTHYVVQANGNKHHCIKITSWNITGIRKLPSKRGITYLQNEKSDIIALQEVRSPID